MTPALRDRHDAAGRIDLSKQLPQFGMIKPSILQRHGCRALAPGNVHIPLAVPERQDAFDKHGRTHNSISSPTGETDTVITRPQQLDLVSDLLTKAAS